MGANLLLTVAICTKNREPQLENCVTHAVRSAADAKEVVRANILIVDDGNLSQEVKNSLKSVAEAHAVDMKISRKSEVEGTQSGLYGSRRYAAIAAPGDYLLFIDDDCNIAPTYITELISTFIETGAVGVGGVDHNNVPAKMAPWKEFLFTVFLLWGNKNGSLSRTGFNYGHHLWRRQDQSFKSDWLHGCNMAFFRKALLTLPSCPWLEGHSACEDLVISHHAAKSGMLFVNPKLDFKHLEVPGGRGSIFTRAKKKILGHWNFLLLRERSIISKIMFAWSVLGFALYMIAKKIPGTKPNSQQYGIKK